MSKLALAVQSATNLSKGDVPDLERIRRIKEEVLESTEDLFGIEKDQREKANKILQRAKIMSAVRVSGFDYKKFDPECFGWRDDKGIPALVPFTLERDEVYFGANVQYKYKIPECVEAHYADVLTTLEMERQRMSHAAWKANTAFMCMKYVPTQILCAAIFYMFFRADGWIVAALMVLAGLVLPIPFAIFDKGKYREIQQLGIKAKFNGLIPKEIRNKIRTAMSSGVFREVFLLCEIPDLKIQELPQAALMPIGDPLVIGFDGCDFWLIAAFDTTSVEAMAQSAGLA